MIYNHQIINYYFLVHFACRTFRTCTKTCTIGDLTIPEGAMVDVPLCLLSHLPEYWSEPEDFIPERLVMVYSPLRTVVMHVAMHVALHASDQ